VNPPAGPGPSGVEGRRQQAAELGRVAGVVAALGVCGLWMVFVFWNPYDTRIEPPTMLLGSTMILAAALAGAAAARKAHLAMYLLFIVSFFPVGFYVMLGPGIFQAIGWLELTYLASAVLVHLGVVRETR